MLGAMLLMVTAATGALVYTTLPPEDRAQLIAWRSHGASSNEGAAEAVAEPTETVRDGGVERPARAVALRGWEADLMAAGLAIPARRLDVLDALLAQAGEKPLSGTDADALVGAGSAAFAERRPGAPLTPLERALISKIEELDSGEVRGPEVRAAAIRMVVERTR